MSTTADDAGMPEPKSPKPVTPSELYESGRYEEALMLLTGSTQQLSDEDRRLLVKCLTALGDFDQALVTLQGLAYEDHWTHATRGWCFLEIQQWDGAIGELEKSLQIRETAWVHGVLGDALARGLKNYELDESVKLGIAGHLLTATELPKCPHWVFLRFDNLQTYSDDHDRAISVLKKGLELYPESEELRVKLGRRLLFWGEQAQTEVISVLAPLVLTGNAVALWLTSQAYSEKGDFRLALECVERIHHDEEPLLAFVKADLATKTGRHSYAFEVYKANLEHERADFRFCARLLAAGLLARSTQDQERALEEADSCLEEWLGGEEFYISQGPLVFEGEYFPYDLAQGVDDAAKMLTELAKKRHSGNSELVGRLLYFRYDLSNGGGMSSDKSLLVEAAKTFYHPRMSYNLAFHYREEGKVAQSVDHYLRYLVWYSAQPESDINFYVSIFMDQWDHTTLAKADRLAFHKVMASKVKECQDESLVRDVFIPFYETCWKPILKDGQLHREIALTSVELLTAAPEDCDILWDAGYYSQITGDSSQAEAAYRKLLELAPQNSSAMHNLSLLLKAKGDLEEAHALSKRAVFLDPDQDLFSNNFQDVRDKLAAQAKERQRQEGFLKTAPERWSMVDRYKRQILAALAVVGKTSDLSDLARYTGMDLRLFEGHWRKLIELGMVVRDSKGSAVNEYILDLVKQERTHSVVTRIIRADATIAFKPIFNSQVEYTVYNVLVGLFPNQLVFPNIGLQAIFQYDRMKGLLASDAFKYFLMAQADFCITSTSSYLPVMAFEVDSFYHDQPKQARRDELKDLIFRLGGVPLVRLRPFGTPTPNAIRQQIIHSVRTLGRDLVATDDLAGRGVILRMELDLSQFGFDGK